MTIFGTSQSSITITSSLAEQEMNSGWLLSGFFRKWDCSEGDTLRIGKDSSGISTWKYWKSENEFHPRFNQHGGLPSRVQINVKVIMSADNEDPDGYKVTNKHRMIEALRIRGTVPKQQLLTWLTTQLQHTQRIHCCFQWIRLGVYNSDRW